MPFSTGAATKSGAGTLAAAFTSSELRLAIAGSGVVTAAVTSALGLAGSGLGASGSDGPRTGVSALGLADSDAVEAT